MDTYDLGDKPASKRRKLDTDVQSSFPNGTRATAAEAEKELVEGKVTTRGLNRPISPPLTRRQKSTTPAAAVSIKPEPLLSPSTSKPSTPQTKYIASPIQLTRIRDLSDQDNVDTVGLEDILGHPLIKECWNFNFLFDVEFVMGMFDRDVRAGVEVKIVHGFWRKDDERRIGLMEAAEQYPNVSLISAYMPDPFGTHHSKMLILFRHDDLAQVIIHTANMIPRDWGNMTQAVWRSPLLPLLPIHSSPNNVDDMGKSHPIGSGERFKVDLLRYVDAYGHRLKDLRKELVKYDFGAVRAAFIGCTPSRQKPGAVRSAVQTSWGWLGLQEILSSIPIKPKTWAGNEEEKGTEENRPNIVMQVSSIATLGPTPTWLHNFQAVLSRYKKPSTSTQRTHPFSTSRTHHPPPKPKFNLIFPTTDEIRNSLDGYRSGASIHTKLQSVAQQKQLLYLRPIFCHWGSKDTGLDTSASTAALPIPVELTEENAMAALFGAPLAPPNAPVDTVTPTTRRAHRTTAAPHIKTYIRFSSASQTTIDWAMVTSANLSKQAWGEIESKKGEVWIQSWEVGVVVWGDLFKEDEKGDSEEVIMVSTFGRDMPTHMEVDRWQENGDGSEDKEHGDAEKGKQKTVVGFRMPYDLPLHPYGEDEIPWCATDAHSEPDRYGGVWKGYHAK